jgi:TolA-binding protein
VNKKIQVAEQYLQKYGQGKGPAVVTGEEGAAQAVPKPDDSRQAQEMSAVAKQFYNAVSLLSQQKYQEALVEFRKIVAENQDEEYTAKSQYEMGRSLYYLKQYDASIQAFSTMISKYPTHPDLREALYYAGNCYAEKGDSEKAKGFFNKILSMPGDEDAVSRKVKKALRDLGGGG